MTVPIYNAPANATCKMNREAAVSFRIYVRRRCRNKGDVGGTGALGPDHSIGMMQFWAVPGIIKLLLAAVRRDHDRLTARTNQPGLRRGRT